MNRDDLGAFFARAEDVLTDWKPSGDAMVARVADEGVDPPRADSYYQQARRGMWPATFVNGELLRVMERAVREAMARAEDFSRACADSAHASVVIYDEARDFAAADSSPPDAPLTPVERIIEARRNRNTGPADTHRLDGARRRRHR